MAWPMAKLLVMRSSFQKWSNKSYFKIYTNFFPFAGEKVKYLKTCMIVTLFKKIGDRSECNNYHGISLLSMVGKVFAQVVLARLQILAERIYPEPQCGFRKIHCWYDLLCQTTTTEMQGTTTATLSCLYRLDQSLWPGQQDWAVRATWEKRVPT